LKTKFKYKNSSDFLSDDMGYEEDREKSDNEELIKMIHNIIDSITYLIKLFDRNLTKLRDSLKSLSDEFTALDAVKGVSEAIDSIGVSIDLITGIMPSTDLCRKKRCQKFWYLHSALIVYYYEALMLLEHSLLSAFTAYYSVAFTELRSAMESIVRGVVFDLLAIPKYRESAEKLKEIEGFGNTPGFSELLDVLKEELKDKRLTNSVGIFDVIDRKLEKFNPEGKFAILLGQLKNWEIIDNKLFQDINSYYMELSKPVHRVHPKFSDVGMRILADKDWLELEPIPDELSIYLDYFADLNGLFTYLVLRTFTIDLVRDEYKKCVDWSRLDKGVQSAVKLKLNHKFWEYAVQILEQSRI